MTTLLEECWGYLGNQSTDAEIEQLARFVEKCMSVRIKNLRGLSDNLEQRAEKAETELNRFANLYALAEARIITERETITRHLVEHRKWADAPGRLPENERFAVVSALNAMVQFCEQRRRSAGVPNYPTIGPACPRGGEIVDYCIGLCSCGKCPTPRPDWTDWSSEPSSAPKEG